MTNQLFIHKIANNEFKEKKTRSHGSLFYDRLKDTIYSYGYHYPLLFPIKLSDNRTLYLVNNQGYSNTTSKHIGLASRYASYSVALPNTRSQPTIDLNYIQSTISNQLQALQQELLSLKRHKTQREANIIAKISNLESLKNIIK